MVHGRGAPWLPPSPVSPSMGTQLRRGSAGGAGALPPSCTPWSPCPGGAPLGVNSPGVFGAGAFGRAPVRNRACFQRFFHPWGFTRHFCWFLLLSCAGFWYLFLAASVPSVLWHLTITPFPSSPPPASCLISLCSPSARVCVCFFFFLKKFPLKAFPFVFADHLQQRPRML